MSGTFLDEYTEKTVVKSAKPKLQEPKKYKVILVNDDYTPMDYVIFVLQSYFNMNEARATQVMLQVHNQGKGICGIFTRDIAETKVAQVNQSAQQSQYPLLCIMEPE